MFTVNIMSVVVLRALGNPGFWMYEQFWFTVDPDCEVTKMQQMPNLTDPQPLSLIATLILKKNQRWSYPAAHDPEKVPLLLLHSELVKHVPFRCVPEELL